MRICVSNFLMFFLALLMLLQPAQARAAYDINSDTALVCMNATQKMEKVYQIKKHMLTTISNVETGRWNERHKQKTAWPWTVNAQGKGMFFKTKAEAVKEVKRLQAEGVKSIDVGCMQINLVYHPDAFENIEEAFDPQTNVEYAAKFLKNLYENNGKDWIKAAMAYHSSVPGKALQYKKKIVSTYELVKQAQNNLDKKLFGEQNKEKIGITENSSKHYAKNGVAKTARLNVSDQRDSANKWREAKLAEWRALNR